MIEDKNHYSLRTVDVKGVRYVSGYAAVFNVLSYPIYEQGHYFREILQPDCFRDVLYDNVVFNVNHDNAQLLARTTAKTLTLMQDSKGLHFRARLPRTNLADDIYELIRSGHLNECSFVFMVGADDVEWRKDSNGGLIRVVNHIKALRDVTVCPFPAYPQTEAEARKMEQEGVSFRGSRYHENNVNIKMPIVNKMARKDFIRKRY
jgi:HK97 family phage prohead protease